MLWMWRHHGIAVWRNVGGAWHNALFLTTASNINCWAGVASHVVRLLQAGDTENFERGSRANHRPYHGLKLPYHGINPDTYFLTIIPYLCDHCKWFDVELLHLWMFYGDLGKDLCTRAQSCVTCTSHRFPVMVGPSDKWLTLGYMWVCCCTHVDMHYHYHYHHQYFHCH